MSKAFYLKETLLWLKEIGVEGHLAEEPQRPYDWQFARRLEKESAPSTPPIERATFPQKAALPLPPLSSSDIFQNRPVSLEDITTLEGLKKMLQEFDGCALKRTAMNLVFGDGNPKARVMVVGEAPGADEDRQGLPFVGKSGQLLQNIFGSIGLKREDIYITNIVPWRPPGNRPPTSNEIALCLPFIRKHIALVAPQFLILLGGIATKSILDQDEGITRLRGKWFSYDKEGVEGCSILATYHPAFLLRSPSKKKDVWQDMQALQMKLIEGASLST